MALLLHEREAVSELLLAPRPMQFCSFFGSLAQLVEQRTFNPLVAGSNPARPTNIPLKPRLVRGFFLSKRRKKSMA